MKMADKKCHLSHFKTGGNAYISVVKYSQHVICVGKERVREKGVVT